MRIVVAGATGTVGAHLAREATERGHEVVALSRRSGQDVTTGAGLAATLAGADAVIDVTSVGTTSAKTATAFFDAATRNLQRAEQETGVPHHIALSIVGIDDIDVGYYAGKLAQERLVAAAAGGWSILRAAQFHEFPGQVLVRGALGPISAVPKGLVRPVAAREVATALVDVAEAGPAGRVPDVVGPRDEDLADLTRRLLRHEGRRRPVLVLSLPGAYWKGLRSGVLRGLPDARHGTVTFDEWLDSPDHHRARD